MSDDERLSPEELLNAVLERYDTTITLEIASQCLWSAELRFITKDDDHYPSRGVTFYSTANHDTSEAIANVIADALLWLEEGNDPLSPPEDDDEDDDDRARTDELMSDAFGNEPDDEPE